MVGRLFAKDPQLYTDIIMASDDNIDLIVKYYQSVGNSVALLKEQNREKFISQFEQISINGLRKMPNDSCKKAIHYYNRLMILAANSLF